MSVNRTELVAKIAERANISKVHADAALAAFQDVLVESLSKGETVKVTGLLSPSSALSVQHAPAATPAPAKRSRSPQASASSSPLAPP